MDELELPKRKRNPTKYGRTNQGLARVNPKDFRIIRDKEEEEKQIKKYSFNLVSPFNRFAEEKYAIYKKLSQDIKAKTFLDWCENVKIRTKDYGIIQFSPNRWNFAQWKAISAYFDEEAETIYILKGRQLGITTITILFDLYWAFCHKDLQGIIVGADYEQVRRPIFIAREIYKSLPAPLKLKTLEDSLVRIRFANGAYFDYHYPAKRIASQGKMGRGSAVNYAHFTEFAFMANEEDIDAIEASFSTHYPYRKYIYESTANGYNFYYDRWKENQEIPTSRCIFTGWWAREDYVITNPKELEIYLSKPVFPWEEEKIKEVQELYNVKITPEQMAWWRKQAITKYSKDEKAVLKEFPFTEHDAFSTTGKEFFYMRGLKEESSIELPRYVYQVIFSSNWQNLRIEKKSFGAIKVWRHWTERNPYAQYVMGVDPAFSSNPLSDNSAFIILECYADKIIQIAEFAMNTIDVSNFALLCLYFGTVYDAIVNYDITGGGHAFIATLQNLYYSIINQRYTSESEILETVKRGTLKEYIYRRRDSLSQAGAKGVVLTPEIKQRAVLTLNAMIVNREIHIKSESLLEEIENIIYHEGEIRAKKSTTSQDRLMALLIAIIAYQDLPKGSLLLYEEAQKKFEEFKKSNSEEKKQLEKKEVYQNFQSYITKQWITSLNRSNINTPLKRIG